MHQLPQPMLTYEIVELSISPDAASVMNLSQESFVLMEPCIEGAILRSGHPALGATESQPHVGSSSVTRSVCQPVSLKVAFLMRQIRSTVTGPTCT
jgi:hypothetical protein